MDFKYDGQEWRSDQYGSLFRKRGNAFIRVGGLHGKEERKRPVLAAKRIVELELEMGPTIED